MELAERIADYGAVAYLVTVGPEGRPHVVAVRVEVDGAELVMAAGRQTSGNAAERPAVTVVWAAPPGGAYGLIVDGTARANEGRLRLRPTRAVLHRTPDGDPSSPSCITVLPPA